MNGGLNWKKIVFPCVVIILLFVVIFSGLLILESTVFNNGKDKITITSLGSKTIKRDETEYFPRQDITTLLVMGIDEEGKVQSSGERTNDGMADMLALVIFDEKNQKIDVISINRDSMVNMPVLDEKGKRSGTAFGQIGLSHGYGTGLEDSCENTAWTVSDLFYGTKIDYYLSMNMEAVPILNDAVGGVTVVIDEEFAKIYPEMDEGEYKLRGKEALTFVRARREVGDHLNVSRMERQKEYMDGFIGAAKAKVDEDALFALDLFEKIEPYMVTNCSVETLSSMLEKYENYEMCDIVSPEGENILGEKYYEFYIDEENLDDIIIKYLYAPKK